MAKLISEGFDDFDKRLKEEINRVHKISELNEEEISQEELFDDSGFVEKYTEYTSLDEFLKSFGRDISDEELFDPSPSTEFNKFVRKSTDNSFRTFKAFHKQAGDEYIDNLL